MQQNSSTAGAPANASSNATFPATAVASLRTVAVALLVDRVLSA